MVSVLDLVLVASELVTVLEQVFLSSDPVSTSMKLEESVVDTDQGLVKDVDEASSDSRHPSMGKT